MDQLFVNLVSRNFFIGIVSLLLLSGCGGDSAQQEAQEEEITDEEILLEEEITQTDIAMEDFQRMLDEVPEPTQVPVLIEESGAPFNESLLVPIANTQDYMTTQNKAALALGAYSSDLGYLCVYGKSQDAIDYLTANQKLVEQIGIGSALEASLVKRFEANISNTDSLVSIVNQSIDLAKDYLSESERFQPAALIATGSLIEGLFIATSLVESQTADTPEQLKGLIKAILLQKESLEDLVSVLDVVSYEDESLESLKMEVRNLYDMYDMIGIEQKLEEAPEQLLTDETLTDITAKVKEIRAQMIKP